MLSMVVLLSLAANPSPSASQPAMPAALQRAIAGRLPERLKTAHVEYMVSNAPDETGAAGGVRFYTYQAGGATFATTDQGDEDGRFTTDEELAKSGAYLGPLRTLARPGETWLHAGDAPFARLMDEGRRQAAGMQDIRLSFPGDTTANPLDMATRVRAAGLPPITYTERLKDAIWEVTAESAGGSLKWWIDPQRGWSIVKTEAYLDGKLIGRTLFEVAEYDGQWFPARMEKYRLAAGDVEPSTVVDVIAAEFNRPGQPAELTPEDIGIEVGTAVNVEDASGQSVEQRFWAGDGLIGPEEFFERVAAGDLHRGPTVQRELERIAAGAGASLASGADSSKIGDTSAWARYVRKFIVAHRLINEKAMRAWEILGECRSEARAYLAHEAPAIEAWEQESAKTAEEGQEAEADTQRLNRLEKRRKALAEPIDEIFERHLKPGLERLLPAKERRGAVSQPTNAPHRD